MTSVQDSVGAAGVDPRAVGLPLHGTRFCVVGLNYAPEPTGSAPYTAGLAEMLAGFGAEVAVIAGVPHYPAWELDPAYRGRLRWREQLNGVDVRRARHYVPRRQSAVSRMLWDGSFLLNAGLMRPDSPPHAVIASTPALSGAVVGARLAARYEVPFGVVVQDLVGQAARQSGVKGGSAVATAAGRVEGGALRSADLIAVVSDAFRDQVAAYGVPADRVTLLRNWTHIAAPTRPRDEVRRELGWRDDQFVVLHTGNMGLKQDLGNVVEAARLLGTRGALPPSTDGVRREVVVVLLGDGNQRADLEALGAGVAGLRFERPVDSDTYPDVLGAADLLLVNERPTVGDMSLPSKLTSYFASGRPVLAAVSDGGACARELAAAAGAAVRVDPGEPMLLADAIVAFAADLGRSDDMGRAGSAYAERVLGPRAAQRNVLDFGLRVLSARHRPSRSSS